MRLENLKKGTIKLEISAINVEKVLNGLWRNHINITNIEKINLTTVRFKISYSDYKEAIDVVKRCNGKFKVVWKSNLVTMMLQFKRRISLIIGIGLFFCVIYLLSNYIWAIEIKTENNLSPFEVRKELKEIGIKPGIKKKDINVYNIEKKMEDLDDSIMWIRTRIEGSALKVIIKEKINPPQIENKRPEGVYAKMDGEIKRIYTVAGNPAVMPGDIVKKGDVLISSSEGREGFEREVQPYGTVIANTFYNNEMEIQISGSVLKRTGNKSSDIFLNIYNRKIYLKKHIKQFDSYDKIEERNGTLNIVSYYEKKREEVNLDKDKEIQKCADILEKSLKRTLSNDAVIVDKKIEAEENDEKIIVKVVFTVEQNIAENDW